MAEWAWMGARLAALALLGLWAPVYHLTRRVAGALWRWHDAAEIEQVLARARRKAARRVGQL